MRTKKLLSSVEGIARSLAQRYDLDYNLVLAAVRQVLEKFKTLNEMNTIEKLTWQKKAGIISETQYREAVEALSSEDAIREMVRETVTGLLGEKRKSQKTSQKPEEKKIDMDIETGTPEGAEGETPEGEEQMPMGEPQPAGDPAQQVEDGLMTAFQAAGEMGNEKLQTQISNTLTMLQRERLASSKTETPTAPAL